MDTACAAQGSVIPGGTRVERGKHGDNGLNLTEARPADISGASREKPTSSPYAQPPFCEEKRYLVDGELRQWTGDLMPIHSSIPSAKGETTPLGSVPKLSAEAVGEIVESAVQAYDEGLGVWPSLSAEERIASVEKCLGLFQAKREEVVHLLVWEIGKSVADAEKEFDRTIDYVRDTIRTYRDIVAKGRNAIPTAAGAITTEPGPRGVVFCMGPSNYPLNESLTTVFPALLVGNSVILKPAKQGVLLLAPLLEAMQKSFPPGVISVLFGDGFEVVPPVMRSGRVDSLAFIGSSGAAKAITSQHPAGHTLHKVLGLGAKNPGVILPSADLDKAVRDVVTGSLTFNGQRCTALKILFVHRSIADSFVEKLSSAVSGLKKGLPWEKGVSITPLYEPGKVAAMEGYVEDAIAHGARIVNEGGGHSTDALYTPAVLYPVTPEMKIYREEQFGPVVPVVPFDHENEVIAYVKSSPVRQQASVFGTDQDEQQALTARLRRMLPRVNVNAPCQRGPDFVSFGAMKDSGLGELSITKALEAFSVERVTAVK
jgi:glyceraldehyde-3-phosphate dehydrogenase (NADP+)